MANRFDRIRLAIGGLRSRPPSDFDDHAPDAPGETAWLDSATIGTDSSQTPEQPAASVPEGGPGDPLGGVADSGPGGDAEVEAAPGDDEPPPASGQAPHVADPAAPGRRIRKSARKGRDEVRGMGAGDD